MSRNCTVCTHTARASIDRQLVQGGSNRRIAAQSGLVETSVRRHRDEHLPALLTLAYAAEETARADDLLEQVQRRQTKAERLETIADGLIGRLVQAGDLRGAAVAVQTGVTAGREARACLELRAKLLGELDERPVVNILLNPQWQQLVVVLRRTLTPHPIILAEVSAALEDAARAA